MPIFTVGAAGTTTSSSYEIANSLRFNAVGSNNSLKKTFSSAGNQQTMTFSFWVKRSIVAEDFGGGGLFGCGTADGDELNLTFRSNVIDLRWEMTNGTQGDFRTNRKFRDMSAWYHIVLALDSTQSTSSNRIRIYVNGVEETSFGEAAYPNQNLNFKINGTVEQEIGRFIRSDKSLVGYLAEFVFIDGQQLTPSSLGEFDEDSGIWKPKDVSDLTFGSNGYHLDFEDSSSLGNDVSGNNNDWTPNNFSATNQSVDTPTNNYNVLNVLTQRAGGTIEEGGLKYTAATSDSSIFGTLPVPAGMKVYFEVKLVNNTAQNAIGIFNEYDPGGAFKKGGDGAGTYSYKVRGAASYTQYFNNGSVTTTSIGNYSNDTIIGVAIDNSNGQIHYHANGTYINSSDPTDNNPTALVTGFGGSSEQYLHFSLDTTSSQPINQYNFGSPPYSISSGNSDGNGHGNFEYAVPSGYYALNSKNLAQFG